MTIIREDGKLKVESVVATYEAKARIGLTQIEQERAALADSPTNAEVIQIIDRSLNRQAEMIKLLIKIIRYVT